MNKIISFLDAFRLKTLPAVLGPLIIAISLSLEKSFDLPKIILIILLGIFLQILVNLLNDVQDFDRGIDTQNRAGPKRVMQSGKLSINEMHTLIILILIICLVLGIIAFLITNYITIILGALLFLLAYTYTGGPKPYGYNGLGELSVIVVFGPLTILGSLYIFGINPNLNTLVISLIPGLTASLIILINNIRDMENDKIGGKITLSVRIGEKSSRYLFLAIIYITITLVIFSLFQNDKFILSIPFIISILFLFPLKDLGFKLFAYDLSVNIKNSKKLTELNSTLIKTVRAHFLICIILSIILVI